MQERYALVRCQVTHTPPHTSTHLHGVCVCVVCHSAFIQHYPHSLTFTHIHCAQLFGVHSLTHSHALSCSIDQRFRCHLSRPARPTCATDQRDRPARRHQPTLRVAHHHFMPTGCLFTFKCSADSLMSQRKATRSLQTALQTTQSGKSRHDSSGGHLFGQPTISHRSRTCSHWDRRRGVTTFRNETDLTSQLSRHDGMTGFVSG